MGNKSYSGLGQANGLTPRNLTSTSGGCGV